MIRILVLLVPGYIRLSACETMAAGQNDIWTGESPGRPVDLDVIIKDPRCGVYFPRRDGVALEVRRRRSVVEPRRCR